MQNESTHLFDIFMCTHNSEKLLPVVLPQIEKVIPNNVINRRFIVDDFSTDETKKVAESLGWKVYINKKRGLGNAQKYAFSLVETKYCAIFEHDLYLTADWFPTIPNLVYSGEYDIAQGIRLRDVAGFREADLHQYNSQFTPSEDNTFYKMITNNGRRYIEKNVCSQHLRGSLLNCLRHDYTFDSTYGNGNTSAFFKCLVKSPFLSLKIFNETKGKSVLFCYPMERIFMFLGWLVHKEIGEP